MTTYGPESNHCSRNGGGRNGNTRGERRSPIALCWPGCRSCCAAGCRGTYCRAKWAADRVRRVGVGWSGGNEPAWGNDSTRCCSTNCAAAANPIWRAPWSTCLLVLSETRYSISQRALSSPNKSSNPQILKSLDSKSGQMPSPRRYSRLRAALAAGVPRPGSTSCSTTIQPEYARACSASRTPGNGTMPWPSSQKIPRRTEVW
jgi:hypothetical protein